MLDNSFVQMIQRLATEITIEASNPMTMFTHR